MTIDGLVTQVEALREELAAERKRREEAERERDALRRHYDAAGPDHNLLALLDLYHERQTNAERERDEAKAECERLRRQGVEADESRMRAEADNVALLEALRVLMPEERAEWVILNHKSNCAVFSDEESECSCGGTESGRIVAHARQRPNPGAAMLERMRALEKVRESVRPIEGRVRALVDFDVYPETEPILLLNYEDFPDVAQAQQVAALLDACAAYDALKVPRE